jgi:hypothetical protein
MDQLWGEEGKGEVAIEGFGLEEVDEETWKSGVSLKSLLSCSEHIPRYNP